MNDRIRRLPDVEQEVMQAIWACAAPVARTDIEVILLRDQGSIVASSAGLIDGYKSFLRKTGKESEQGSHSHGMVLKEDFFNICSNNRCCASPNGLHDFLFRIGQAANAIIHRITSSTIVVQLYSTSVEYKSQSIICKAFMKPIDFCRLLEQTIYKQTTPVDKEGYV